jgi:hypothetical protein
MDYCSLDDAFPAVVSPAPAPAGGGGERKKSKKSRNIDIKTIEMPGPFSASPPLPAGNNADRQAYKRSSVPEPLRSADDMLISAFENVPPVLPMPAADASMMRRKDDTNWFGAAGDDDEMDFMPYTGSMVKDDEYMLQPDFAKTFMKGGDAGLDRAAGIPMSATTMSEQWKTIREDAVDMVSGRTSAAPDDLKLQVRDILKRLDSIEDRGGIGQVATESANTEILMFTMSGLFVMFLMDVIARSARRL